MRIGFDAKRIFFNNRGLGSYGRNLLWALLKNYTQHEYYLYSPNPHGSSLFSRELKNHENLFLKTPNLPRMFNGFWRTYLLGSQLVSDQIDLYHGLSHELPLNLTGTTKKVVTIHDLIFLKYPQFFSPMNRGIYINKIRHACKVADVIIAISEATKHDLLVHLKIPEEKIIVVYQSCDEVFYAPSKLEDNLEHLAIPSKYILFVGALIPHKNPMAILKAMKLMTEEDCHLVIVGKGKKYYRQMQTYLQLNNLSDRVHFISNQGPITNQQLALLYKRALMFVFPSMLEGFGIPIIEAMFSGTPVIINQGAGLSEAAGDAACQLDVNDSKLFAKTMDRIIQDRSWRKELIAGGELHVQKFRQETIAEQLMKCYQGLLDSSPV